MTTNKRIKVIHLLEWFELGGGLERMAGEIALGLQAQNCEVEIWCIARGGGLVKEYQNRGVTVRILNIPTYHNPLNILKLARLFKEHKPDIIHAHIYFAATIGRLAGLLSGVPVMINHVHSTYRHYSIANLWMEKILSKSTNKIICVSDSVKRYLIDSQKCPEDKLIVIHNGVPKKDILMDKNKFRESLGLTADDMVITSVASLFENKGHKILLQAIHALKNKYERIKCLIVGAGPLEEDLKKQSKALGLENTVIFLGVRDDVPNILTASDIFTLTSIDREGHPVSILEAMAYGTVVVASQIGGVGEIITHNENGLLVAPANVDLLAGALGGLISDMGLRTRLKESADKSYREKFDIKFMVDKLNRLYHECLEKID
jgi:glycosyltransferase involved in cell wall biosynthesis